MFSMFPGAPPGTKENKENTLNPCFSNVFNVLSNGVNTGVGENGNKCPKTFNLLPNLQNHELCGRRPIVSTRSDWDYE